MDYDPLQDVRKKMYLIKDAKRYRALRRLIMANEGKINPTGFNRKVDLAINNKSSTCKIIF